MVSCVFKLEMAVNIGFVQDLTSASYGKILLSEFYCVNVGQLIINNNVLHCGIMMRIVVLRFESPLW